MLEGPEKQSGFRVVMYPAAVGVPAEVRSSTGRNAEEKLSQLGVDGDGSLSLGA